MISPGAQAYEDALRERAEAWVADATLDDQRQELDAFFAASTAEPRGVTYTKTELAGVRAQWVDPTGVATDRVLLFVHGGGYMFCSIESHAKLVGHLCKAIGCRGLNLGYRLAPEHPHPAAIEDSTATYRALLEMGIEPQHLAIAGDSAGGNLTLATCSNCATTASRCPRRQ
jgi:monoterpene epsilon-lactone hydrolase